MKIINEIRKILRVLISIIMWLFMLYPLYFTFKGLFSEFTFLKFGFSKGIETYFTLVIIFISVALLLLIVNIIVGSLKKRRKLNIDDAYKNEQEIKNAFNNTYKYKSFSHGRVVKIDTHVDDVEYKNILNKIHGGK